LSERPPQRTRDRGSTTATYKARWCPGWIPDRWLAAYSVGRAVQTWPHRAGRGPFPWYWVSALSTFTSHSPPPERDIAASSHTDLVARSDWVRVMASTRQQPIRRGTVARTGFTSLDVGSGVSGSGTRSSLRGSASRELCYSATSEPSILGFLIKIIKPVGHYFVDASPQRTQHPTM
jgi:hypothetical protein